MSAPQHSMHPVREHIFVLQNRERKSVDFLVFEINSRQWVNIAVAIALGVALDRLFLSWWHRRAKSKKKN